MDNARRRFLLSTLFGSSWVGLRALATGLPLGMLLDPRRAYATTPGTCTGITNPQYLALITSYLGDPLNANVPGCYLDPGIYHSAAATMTPTPMNIGGTAYTAALPWTQLDPALLSRTSFLHHGTYTNAHGDAPKVQKLMGAVMRQEMMVSLFSQSLATCMGTVQSQPVVLSQNLISSSGAVLPVLNPVALQKVLSAPTGPLATLQQQRDADVNKLNALFKANGRKADQAILDQYALSQTQVRSLSQTLLADLATIKGTTRQDLNTAAAVLFKMNVSPAAVMTYSWGGDNHADVALANEAAQTSASVLVGINDLYVKLKNYGLQDRVIFACQNVFGRTLSIKSHSNNADGRNHNANHHATVLIGAGIKASVIGGVTLDSAGTDYRAMGFDSSSGAPNDAGDIPYEATLGSVGKTIGAALGVAQTVLDTQITMGKVIPAALA